MEPPHVTASTNQGLRSDAEDNRERLLVAALIAIARDGQQVPLARIAADAGVGVGTLYRRFPDRESLFDALQVRAYGIVLETLSFVEAQHGTGLEAVESFLRRTVETRSQLFLPWHGSPAPSKLDSTVLGARVAQRVAELLSTGVRDRTVRPNVTARDVIVFGALMAQSLSAIEDWDDVALAQIRIFLNGISAQAPP
jgi:AcrR family transcriptional regulator